MSRHTPGYHGFIPNIKSTSSACEQSKGENTRDTFLK